MGELQEHRNLGVAIGGRIVWSVLSTGYLAHHAQERTYLDTSRYFLVILPPLNSGSIHSILADSWQSRMLPTVAIPAAPLPTTTASNIVANGLACKSQDICGWNTVERVNGGFLALGIGGLRRKYVAVLRTETRVGLLPYRS